LLDGPIAELIKPCLVQQDAAFKALEYRGAVFACQEVSGRSSGIEKAATARLKTDGLEGRFPILRKKGT
jgi:hypothetical protein